ncbi:sulfotransferase [Allopontixanthobacter sp.]|uniref:sulfotransferase n=1 Tax=Allopontixanthobacter sp. TaxID=2906452 RepID=UPI002AB8525C|nr:sulfotransferase [Allopontixanthobacter sp.]MDZ4307593.1 sulfotransferase [Allopontixanthobacter sp.]
MYKRNILFLIYQNRTGSTFLANQLSQHPDVAVAPEGHEPLERLLSRACTPSAVGARIERLGQDLTMDPKLSSWKVSSSLLGERAAAASDELDIFYALCDSFADTHRPNASWVAVKGHFLSDLIARHGYQALQRDRKVRAIFLIRDPRAMFVSQRESLSSRTHQPMQDNPLVAGLRWRQAVNEATRLSHAPFGMMVRYEDLILENEPTLGKIAELLGLDSGRLSAGETAEPATLVELIPDEQKHLHRNVGRGPMADRIDRWQKKLSTRETMALELIPGRAMQRLGYKRHHGGRLGVMDIGAMIKLATSAGWRKLGKLTGRLKAPV